MGLWARIRLPLLSCAAYSLVFLVRLPVTRHQILAAIDYAVCQRSELFIGNSVSTFSAHLLLERAHHQQQVSSEVGGEGSLGNLRQAGFHYNSGSVPLASVLFGTSSAAAIAAHTATRRRLVWVFVIDADAGQW
jgi:hypothetical protein